MVPSNDHWAKLAGIFEKHELNEISFFLEDMANRKLVSFDVWDFTSFLLNMALMFTRASLPCSVSSVSKKLPAEIFFLFPIEVNYLNERTLSLNLIELNASAV